VRIVVPCPPGGPLDEVARTLVLKLSPVWGQQVLVDNRSGTPGEFAAYIKSEITKWATVIRDAGIPAE